MIENVDHLLKWISELSSQRLKNFPHIVAKSNQKIQELSK